MQIETGKFYKTRGGEKVGPVITEYCQIGFGWHALGDPRFWYGTGKCYDGQSYDLIAEWTDTPTIWENKTPEQKGALLLAEHEGRELQALAVDHDGTTWVIKRRNQWHDGIAYRIKPEPKRERTALYGRVYITNTYPNGVFDADRNPRQAGDTHRITFDTIDGEPDCATIRMERLT